MADCVDKKNLGVGSCPALPSFIKGMIETNDSFSATPAQVIDPTFWQDALLAAKDVRAYFWPNFFGTTDQSEANVYETTYLGKRPVRDGFYEWLITISESLCIHKAMFTHRRNNGRVWLWDGKNQLIGTIDADGNYRGLSIQMLHTEKMKFNDGTVVSKSPIALVLKDNLEFDQSGIMIDGSFLNSLSRLTDVTITVVSAISTKIVVTVEVTCDGTPLSGLVLADFKLLNEDGTTHTITSVTEGTGDQAGTYTLNGTGFAAGSLSLVAPSLLTIQAYESNKVFVLGGS